MFVLYQINKSCCQNIVEVAYPFSLQQEMPKYCCCLYPRYTNAPNQGGQVAIEDTTGTEVVERPRVINNYLLAPNPLPRVLGPRDEMELRRLFNNVAENVSPNIGPVNDEQLAIQNA